MDITGIALRGMEAAQQSVEATGRRLANAATPEAAGDLVDLSADMVSLLAARNQFTANARVVHTADEMQKQMLDLFV